MDYDSSLLLAALGGQGLRLFSGWASMSFKAKKFLPFDTSQLHPIIMAGLGSGAAPALFEQLPVLAQLPHEIQIPLAAGLGFIGQVLSRDATKTGSTATVITEKVITKETTAEIPDEEAAPKKSSTHRINDRDDLP